MHLSQELQLFQQLLDRTLELRETVRGAHPPLEKGIDSVTGNGQVRLPPPSVLGKDTGLQLPGNDHCYRLASGNFIALSGVTMLNPDCKRLN